MKHEFAGLPIKQMFSHPALGCPNLLVQFNYPSYFLIVSYFDPSLAYLGTYTAAVFRVHPKKK